MIAAVLCPGPSLREFDGNAGQYDVVIGVNRAAAAYLCDYYVALDARSYEMGKPLGEPVIVTVAHAWAELLNKHPGLSGRRSMVYSDAGKDIKSTFGAFSSTAALVLARYLGANLVHVFGADMGGVQDYDGWTDERNRRDAMRWAKESRQWEALTGELAALGTTVIRIPQESACMSI